MTELTLNATSEWLNLGLMGFMILALGLVAWVAQLGSKEAWARWATYGITGLMSVLSLAAYGLLAFATALKPQLFAEPIRAVAGAMGVVGLWGILCLIPLVRKGLQKSIFPNLNPSLPVHTWSVFVFGAAVVYTGLSIFWLYRPEVFLESFQNVSLPLTVVTTALLFCGFSFLASGPGINGGFKAIWTQLGVTRLPWKTVGWMTLVALGLTVGLEAFERTLLPHLMSPEMQATLQTIMAAFKLQGPPWMIVLQALLLGLGAGIGEEVLFRGLVQPVFGIIPTAVLFALIHVHYGPTPLLAELFVIGCVLGIIRKKLNTTAAIWVHLCFDFLALTSSLIFPHS